MAYKCLHCNKPVDDMIKGCTSPTCLNNKRLSWKLRASRGTRRSLSNYLLIQRLKDKGFL